METAKLSGLLGMANRARKILYGDTAFEALKGPKAALLLISSDASDRTMKQLINRSEHYNVKYRVIDDVLLNQAVGKTTAKTALIIDHGFSKGILDNM
ncbi:MAG: hypothetical protein GX760_02140 [Erysipelothrix sp.]|nr:hypothetical protein [Erysipelothrix sp.]